jgi:nucleoside-diphosphate-sugar epimerase
MLIIGCGDVGARLARHLGDRGESVRGIVRSPESADALRAAGIDAEAVDLDEPSVSDRIAAWDDPRLFYFAPPPSTGTTDPRLGRVLDALPPVDGRRLVYIGTTGVYGDCGGDWVDEARPLNPQVDRARRRHDAEQRLQAWRAAGGGAVAILRVAGIYGPGKLPLARLRQQVPMIAAADAPWTNRIHIDDLVAVCAAAMDRAPDGAVYNVSDGTPGNMRDYFDRVADLFDLPRAPLVSLDEARQTLSPGLLSYLGESRRLDNRRMLDELGIRLRYPDLDRGLAAIAASQAD